MPYKHTFRCFSCRSSLSFKSLRQDPDDPPLPSLFHGEMAAIKEARKPANERKQLLPQVTNCTGRLLFLQTEVIAGPPPPVARTVLDYSREYALGAVDGEEVNTVSAAHDVVTDARRKGVNAHGIPRASLHATLRGILDRLDQIEAWSVDNCAEIEAVDKLLKAGSLPANIRVHTRDRRGDPKPPCENCQSWLQRLGDGSFKIR